MGTAPSARFFVLAAIAAFATLTAAAAEDVTAEAFERFAEGKTLYFTRDGLPFGAESYFPGRRSLWRFEDGTCEEGRWWGEGSLICFEYADDPAQCWRFGGGPGGFVAESVRDGAPTGFALRFDHADDRPLDCPGPKVGS